MQADTVQIRVNQQYNVTIFVYLYDFIHTEHSQFEVTKRAYQEG
jgi:hypothetical protein